MDIFFLLFAIICLIGIKINYKSFFDDYMTKKQTNAINGIFVAIVFFSHFSQYAEYDAQIDRITSNVTLMLGQLMVVMFLLYSGYGVMTSIKNKGKEYVKHIPYNRIFKTWYHFFIAVLLFAITDLIVGKYYDLSTFLLSIIGLKAIGNSNWYVFAILCLYFFTYVGFSISKNKYISFFIVLAMSLAYILIMYKSGYSTHWYNTVIAYSFGIFYALFKDKIDMLFGKNGVYFPAIILLLISFVYMTRFSKIFAAYELRVLIFALTILLITKKIKIGNCILNFLGNYTFEIYILQRIPMIVFTKYIQNKYFLFLICLSTTLLLAVTFKMATNKIDGIIYKTENKNKN